MLEKKTIGHYKILDKVGQGGMGAVYKAWDEKRKRYVAVKVLTDPVNETFHRLFDKEVELLATLDHPNIVPLYDVGWYLGVPYFVMGFLEGVSLLDVIMVHQKRRTGFALPFFLSIMRDVTQALHHAHSRNVFHRDLKPENILVTSRKRAVLLDFGLAKLLHDERIIPKNYILGTPHYMSPEQITNGPIDHRTDIYSLGLLMYVCLTGRLPFMDRDGMRGARRRLAEDFPPPSRRNPAIPPQVDEVVMRCVERDPDRRFQLVSDITLVLTRVVEEAAQERLRKASRPVFLRESQLSDMKAVTEADLAVRQVKPQGLPFTRTPQKAAERLDALVEGLRHHLEADRRLEFPFRASFEVLTPTAARALPAALGQFRERSEENRFVHVTSGEGNHLFVKFTARLLRGHLEIRAAMAETPDAVPDLAFDLDLSAWDSDEAADWDAIFAGLADRFHRWMGRSRT